MAQPRMRPRFVVDVASSADQMMTALRESAQDNVHGIVGSFTRRHCVLKIPRERRKFWSPQLTVAIESAEEEATQIRLRCLFSPHPQIWTAFVFIYGTLFVLGLGGTMYGLAELSLDRTPWGFLAPVVTFGLAAFVYGAAFIGQGLGAEEMHQLRAYLGECVEEAERARLATPRTAQDSAQL